MFIDKAYYIQVIERAVALLRQGHPDKALTALQSALDQKVVAPVEFGRGDEDTDLELVFDPRSSETPRCWIEENHLIIDDKTWDVDPQFMSFLIQSIKYSVAQGEDAEKIREGAEGLLKKGVTSGKVKKKQRQ